MSALVMAIGVTVLQRAAIARWAAESWLRQRGVEGLVEITSLDLGHFTGRLRLGDPKRPALQVERMEVDYALLGPWNGQPFGVRTQAVSLERPRLAARLKDGRLTFGVLQPIIDEALRQPAQGPAPTVRIHQGVVTTLTDAGTVVFVGDADVSERMLKRLDGRLSALNLRSGEASLVSSGGPVWARTANGVLTGGATLDLTALAVPGLALTGGALTLGARTAYPQPRQGRLGGSGDFTLGLVGATAAGDGLRGEGLNAKASLPGLQYATGPEGLSLNGAGVVEIAAERLAGPDVSGRSAAAVFRLANLRAASDKHGFTLRADTSGSFNAGRFTAGGAPLAGVALSAEGPLSFGPDGPALTLVGGGSARLAMTPAEANRLAAAAPVLSGEPAYRAALSRALASAQATMRRARLEVGPAGARVTLTEPLLVAARSGARLTLTPRAGRPMLVADRDGARGAASLTLAGGGLPDIAVQAPNWSARAGRLDADLTLTAALDYGAAKGVKTTARGHLGAAPGDARFVLAACAPVTIETLEGGAKDTTGLKGLVCPADQPLFVARRGGWVAHGGFREAGALSQLLSARISDASGVFQVNGGPGRPLAATARIASAGVADTEGPVRFEPVRASGEAALAGEVWTGRLDLTAPSGPPLGEVRFAHDQTTGAGSADVEAPSIVFRKDGFQPIMISPLAEVVAEADGVVAFRGRLDWTRAGLTSSGRVSTTDFAFSTPIGAAHGLATDIALASLNPLVSLPDQTARIARIDALTPLTDVEATFDFDADTARIDAARAVAAKGRVSLEPMAVPLAREGQVNGVVVLNAIDLGDLVAGSTLADAVKLDAVVDGRLPFEAKGQAFRFVEGRLQAVRPGRISISRTALSAVETSTASEPGQVNAVQDFAYQAMENLAFETMSAEVASQAGGRLGVLFRIQGRHDPANRQETRISIRDLIAGDAFKKRIALPPDTPINLTLDTSLNFDELLQALRDIWAAKKSEQRRSAPVQGR